MSKLTVKEVDLLIKAIDLRIEILRIEIAKTHKRSRNWTTRSYIDVMNEAWKEIESLKEKRNKLILYKFGKETRDKRRG